MHVARGHLLQWEAEGGLVNKQWGEGGCCRKLHSDGVRGCSSTGGRDGAYAEPWCSREKEEFGSSVASLVTSDPSIHIIGVTLLDTRLVLLLSRFCNLRSLLTPLAEEKGSPGCQCCMSSTRQCFVFPFYHTSCCTILLSRVTVWGWVSCSFCFWERLLCLKEGDC